MKRKWFTLSLIITLSGIIFILSSIPSFAASGYVTVNTGQYFFVNTPKDVVFKDTSQTSGKYLITVVYNNQTICNQTASAFSIFGLDKRVSITISKPSRWEQPWATLTIKNINTNVTGIALIQVAPSSPVIQDTLLNKYYKGEQTLVRAYTFKGTPATLHDTSTFTATNTWSANIQGQVDLIKASLQADFGVTWQQTYSRQLSIDFTTVKGCYTLKLFATPIGKQIKIDVIQPKLSMMVPRIWTGE